MSHKNVILPPSLKYHPHLYAFDIWMQQTFRRIDLSQILIYFIDKVNAGALPILAQEFNVAGNKGFNFCVDEVAQRAFLKRANQFWRYAGTPWVIEQMLGLVGISSGTIKENMGAVGDGNDWLRFSIEIDRAVMIPTATQITNATTLINEWKNARSIFLGFTYIH
jgi:P2-related tail formation protein